MKKLLLILLCLPMIGMGQFSNYYRVDANINKNVNVKSTINKNVNVNTTVETIDYGQLAAAEALEEKNRLEKAIYADEKERFIALEIAADPIKAYDYGKQNDWKNTKENNGFTKFTFGHRKPHTSLFADMKNYNYQNISRNNITTELEITGVAYNLGLKEPMDFLASILELGPEEYCKGDSDWKVGSINSAGDYLHKMDVNKVKVFRHNGFMKTMIYENDYEYVIKDNYYAIYDNIVFRAGVRYKGDKDEITFEDLEGRRYYLKRLCNQIISTAFLDDYTKVTYRGERKNGKRHGEGTSIYASGDKYVGEWKNGIKTGQGTYTWTNGAKYVGEYKFGLRHGQGTITYASGNIYIGQWRDDKLHGKGTFTYTDGTVKKGKWKKGEFVK